jgi:F-type H+-transporting ATPase subunit gamma
VVTLGKKANSSLRFLGVDVGDGHTGIMDAPAYAQAQAIIEPLMARFLAGDVDLVEVVYSRFESAARQRPDLVAVLPAGGVEQGQDQAAAASAGGSDDFLYHPDPATLLTELIPQTVKTAFFSTLLQTSAGEHAARRVAMKNATDAAGDIIKSLNSRYNRARQGKITQEIAEIVGAVEAMA